MHAPTEEGALMAQRTLVLGLGNLLMGDEGVGVHALESLRLEEWPSNVTLIDGSSGTFHVLARLREFDLALVIEGVEDGAAAGTVSLLSPLDPDHLPRVLERHDVGLRDLVESAALLGPLPRLELITVSIDGAVALTTDLSSAVAGAIPRVRELVRQRVGTRRSG